jgi:hypothetical protein
VFRLGKVAKWGTGKVWLPSGVQVRRGGQVMFKPSEIAR